MYTPSQPDVVDSFTYTNEGDYYVGYTVVFGDLSGCEGMTFQGYKWVWYDDRLKSCDVVDDESVSSECYIVNHFFSLLLCGRSLYFPSLNNFTLYVFVFIINPQIVTRFQLRLRRPFPSQPVLLLRYLFRFQHLRQSNLPQSLLPQHPPDRARTTTR